MLNQPFFGQNLLIMAEIFENKSDNFEKLFCKNDQQIFQNF